MKRMRTTMIALAVSGSLVAGVTPAAMAQDSQGSGTTSDAANPTTSTTANPTTSTTANPTTTEQQEDPSKISLADEAFSRLQTDFNAYTLAGPNQPTYYRHHCGEWVTEQNRIGSDVALTKADLEKSKEIQGQIRADIANRIGFGSPALDGASTVEDPSPAGASVECKIADDSDNKFDPRLLGLILPATLIIGGVIWYLSQDGKTYVQDPARANAQPTAEEQKASEQMLKDNADEVKRQAGAAGDAKSQAQDAKDAAAHGQRGMLAQTGNNDVARGLFALVLLSVVGAAAFLARRRFSA